MTGNGEASCCFPKETTWTATTHRPIIPFQQSSYSFQADKQTHACTHKKVEKNRTNVLRTNYFTGNADAGVVVFRMLIFSKNTSSLVI